MRESNGFSLIELLIAAAIAIIILGLIVEGLRGGASATALVQNRQKLLEDLRASGNFLADTLSRAAYIYPPGTKITLNGPSSYTAHNTRTDSNVWIVGKAPFVAGLLPPDVPGDSCQPDKNKDDYTTSGCLYFVAFYTIKRSYIVKNAGGRANPGADAQNKDDEVMYYYSKVTDDRQILDPLPTTFGDASGSLVADYLARADQGMVVDIAQCAGKLTTSTGCPDVGSVTSKPSANNSATRVEVGLQGRIVRLGRVAVAPNTPLDFYFAPRNLQTP